jgi:dihydrofolate reductase
MNATSSPILSAIAAMAENRVIGKNNQLPWHLPADLQHFKLLTSGHPILMGRKTYQSIGKPLPNRTNIIMTRDPHWQAPAGCVVVTSPEQALQQAAALPAKEIFIIGGAEIYHQLLPITQRIYLTIVHHTFAGDAYFPVLDTTAWQETNRTRHTADEKNAYDYSFLTLERVYGTY